MKRSPQKSSASRATTAAFPFLLLAFCAACAGVTDDPMGEPQDETGEHTRDTGSADDKNLGQRCAETITNRLGATPVWGHINYTKYLYMSQHQIHFFATGTVSDDSIRKVCGVVKGMLSSLNNSGQRNAMRNHKVHLTTFSDPPLYGTQRDGGGSVGTALNSQVICQVSREDGHYRGWDTPVHEFGHAIEQTLWLDRVRTPGQPSWSDGAFSWHPAWKREWKGEWFAWQTQNWFSAGSPGTDVRATMHPQLRYAMSFIFDEKTNWIPTCP